jgi:peptidoglycan/xylan/chitin deacetylase (PgdA/CDA1 family)
MTRPLTDPSLGSAPGWPVVLYFHHVTPEVRHYTALAPDDFRRGIETVLELVGPAIEPVTVRPGFQPPDHPGVLVTFDDGYRDNLELAAPVLAELDVRVLLFCVTGELDRASTLDPATRAALPPRQRFLTWTEADQLAAAGHVLAAHTHTHPKLTELDEHRASDEVDRSLQAVAERTGRPTEAFAYPYGLLPTGRPLPSGVLGFGTVKSPPTPWSLRPQQIRRSYLPVGETARWTELATSWRQQWYGSQ